MTKSKDTSLDLVEFRERLSDKGGERFWKSLEEISEEDGFDEMMDREFPNFQAESESQVDRRGFMKLMGASLALGGLTACDMPPAEKIVPYVNAPEFIVPGNPLFYATTMTYGRQAIGLLVETHEGRPTKIEGNPDHPASLGAANAICQGSVLGLYDPDRSTTLLKLGRISTWTQFISSLSEALAQRPTGRGVRILSETVVSPTIGSQLDEILQTMPQAKWVQFDPAVATDGRKQRPVYDFSKADVVFLLDSDVFNGESGHLRYAREFAKRRRAREGGGTIARLYAAETMPTASGAIADHRFPVRATDMEQVAAMLAGSAAPSGVASDVSWVDAVRQDLVAHGGRAVVIAGDHLSARTHQLVGLINQQLGAVGSIVRNEEAPEVRPTNQFAEMAELVAEIRSGEAEVLLILGGNPVYNTPGSLGFEDAIANMSGLRVHHSLYYDETSRYCDWHVNATHFLENWGDARSFDGTSSIVQPMIEPLYDGKSTIDVLNVVNGKLSTSALDTVMEHWRGRYSGGDFDRWWQTVLHNGVVPNDGVAPVTFSWANETPLLVAAGEPDAPNEGMELVFRPDSAILDGRFANNGWLMELPRPITKVTWDNAAYMSYETAKKMNLRNEDVVTLTYEGGQVSAPVWIVFGHAPDSVTVHLGYGRTRAGEVGSGKGFNANLIRTAASPWGGTGLRIEKTTRTYRVACTQKHFSMHDRDLIRATTIGEFHRMPASGRGEHESSPAIEGLHATAADEHLDGSHDSMPEPNIYPKWEYPGYAWGMSIDTSVCTGCSACLIACVAENNIPVVGKREVLREREMHWIRIDRYYKGNRDAPQTFHQPVPCQQCENAPCEPVCPVGATVHSHEGLNDMVYNRCVGTRYCSNNCPYKVRRFNFFQYADFETESLKLGRNPDVTVRSRGVMEKCTYCVQRINAARIVAERESRQIRDGEIRTACQQGCPTEAIEFGDINDPESRVSKLKAQKHNYSLIEEINTKPRTTYLSTVRNLNPAIESHVQSTEIDS